MKCWGILYGGQSVKKFYERFNELVEKEGYIVTLSSERTDAPGESQWLNCRPEEMAVVGIVPMTGEGIDADVDDISFTEK